MEIDLSGRVALVTGASRGIGAAVAKAFADAGAAVVATARSKDLLDKVVEEIQSNAGSAIAVEADVTDPAAMANAVSQAEGVFGRLDYACNNAAGGGHPPTPLAEVPLEAFESALLTTLTGAFIAMQAEIPAMFRAGGGAIVNMSSTAGLQAVGGLAAYCSAKHGLEGLTKVAALDYGDAGIRVNAIAPGPILTDNLIRAGLAAQEAAASSMPLKRIGQPEEIGACVVWLCSNQTGFMTGQTVVMDGGKLAGTPPFNVQLDPASSASRSR